MRTPALVAAVLTALLAAAPPAARAQAAPDRQAQREANRHFKLGVSLFGEQKYAEALAEFERAYTLAPHPAVLYNLAACHRALSQYGPAVKYYTRFLREGPGQVNAKALAKGKLELDQVMALVTLVEVKTLPPGAMVKADGQEMGLSPLEEPLVLAAGDHIIEAGLAGHQHVRRAIRVAAGDRLTVEIALEVLPEEPADPVPPSDPPPDPGVITEPEPLPPPPLVARVRRFGVSAAVGTNAMEMAETGAPVVGVSWAAGSRVALGLDVVLVAYAAIPNLRLRLAGDALSVHAVAALPVAFTDGEMSETFVAGAAGLGLRWQASSALALRLESWLSYAGGDRGTTLPTFAGAELWF